MKPQITTHDGISGAAVRWIAQNPEAWQILVTLAMQEAAQGRKTSGTRLVRMARDSGLEFSVSYAFLPHIARIMAAAFPALAPYIRTKPLTRTSHR